MTTVKATNSTTQATDQLTTGALLVGPTEQTNPKQAPGRPDKTDFEKVKAMEVVSALLYVVVMMVGGYFTMR